MGYQNHLMMIMSLILALGLGACGGGDAPGAGAQGQGPGQPGAAGGDGNGRNAGPPVSVAVVPALRGDISTHYSATATLEPETEAVILARVNGVVEALLVEEGDQVQAGQELLRIENAEYLYRLRQAEADRARLQARFDRMENMVQQKLVSVEEFEAARSELAAAEAEEGMARTNLSYTRVVAPFSGRITLRHVDLGQNLSPNTELFTLADFDPLLARIHVPAREFRRLQQDQPVELVLDSDGTRLPGRITLVSPVIDSSTGTIKVTVEVDQYPEGVRPGDFVEVRVETQRHLDCILVPKIAVVNDKGEDVVYVDAGGTAERRVVTLGFVDETYAEVIEGVSEAEPVVVRGQRSLRHGQPIKVLEDGAVVTAESAS